MTQDGPAGRPFSLDRRKVLLGCAFGGAAALAAVRQPNRTVDYLGKRKLEDVIPKQIGEWSFHTSSGLIVPPEDQLAQSLYAQLLTRAYVDRDNNPLMLLIAQSAGQTGMLQVHRPEVCYPAAGFSLTPVSRRRIVTPAGPFNVNWLSASKEGITEQIIYWTRIGGSIPLSWAEQRWVVARENLRQVVPDAVLVRLSTYGSSPAVAAGRVQSFVTSLVRSVPPTVLKVLLP